MAVLRITLCAVFMVTVSVSKPVCLSEGEDSSKSSESSEANSSEEAATHVEPTQEPTQEPLQPSLTETALPNPIEATEAPGTAAMLNATALPDTEDPQTSTDTFQLVPDDPLQPALGIDVSRDMPETDPGQHPLDADTLNILPDTDVSQRPVCTDTDIGISDTNQPQVPPTTTYQRFPEDATPPIIKPTPPPFSTAPPLQVPIETALTGVPVCFTFQFATKEPEPPRGDSI